MHACMYDQNERVCHTISRLKSGIQSTPPPTYFFGFQKTWGVGIFHVVRWNISQRFLA